MQTRARQKYDDTTLEAATSAGQSAMRKAFSLRDAVSYESKILISVAG